MPRAVDRHAELPGGGARDSELQRDGCREGRAGGECPVPGHDLGPSNIRVNAISAGPVKTASARAVKDFSKMLDGVAANAPLRRNTDPAEVADTAVF